MPKATFERKRSTGTFLENSVTELNATHLNAAGVVSFKLKPIHEIFPEKIRNELELALTVYLEEMRPFRDTDGWNFLPNFLPNKIFFFFLFISKNRNPRQLSPLHLLHHQRKMGPRER